MDLGLHSLKAVGHVKLWYGLLYTLPTANSRAKKTPLLDKVLRSGKKQDYKNIKCLCQREKIRRVTPEKETAGGARTEKSVQFRNSGSRERGAWRTRPEEESQMTWGP